LSATQVILETQWYPTTVAESEDTLVVAERYAEGEVTLEQLRARFDFSDIGSDCDGRELLADPPPFDVRSVGALASLAASEAARGETTYHAVARAKSSARRTQCVLLRCIFGDMFRTLKRDSFWLTSTATALARGVYDDRAFDRLPLLADALEDAGCTDAELLGHLRGPGPHVRGCWAVDLVLGKR
jgi:hypothetical protein